MMNPYDPNESFSLFRTHLSKPTILARMPYPIIVIVVEPTIPIIPKRKNSGNTWNKPGFWMP
jgi:hypothetical protein